MLDINYFCCWVSSIFVWRACLFYLSARFPYEQPTFIWITHLSTRFQYVQPTLGTTQKAREKLGDTHMFASEDTFSSSRMRTHVSQMCDRRSSFCAMAAVRLDSQNSLKILLYKVKDTLRF